MSLWPRLETLLPQVQKPAREIALSNQGLQILFEILNERPDAAAELGTQPRAVRVSELLAALDPPLSAHKVLRLHQWITTDDDQRIDPMSCSAAASAPVGAT